MFVQYCKGFVVVCVCGSAHVVSSVKDLSNSPGLIAVLSIFIIILGLLLVVGIAKGVTTGSAKFERLDEVPMVCEVILHLSPSFFSQK